MIVPGPNAKIYLAAGATDMRKSFDGLYAMVLGVLKERRWLGRNS